MMEGAVELQGGWRTYDFGGEEGVAVVGELVLEQHDLIKEEHGLGDAQSVEVDLVLGLHERTHHGGAFALWRGRSGDGALVLGRECPIVVGPHLARLARPKAT
jgi:hypothetical protein